MLYVVELGPIEQDLVRQSLRNGMPIPERVENAPELRLGLELYLIAFFDLDSERSHAMGLTRIPWVAIQRYANENDFDEVQTLDLHYFVKVMDTAHLNQIDSKREKTT